MLIKFEGLSKLFILVFALQAFSETLIRCEVAAFVKVY